MKESVQIECWHDTTRKWMYHVVGGRVMIITNIPQGVIKFYKDGKKYNEVSANISVAEFERILTRTERVVVQLEKINNNY